MRRDAGRKGQRIKTSAVVAIGEQWLCNVVVVSAVHKSAISILGAVEWLSHVRLFDPMDGSRPDSLVLHFDPELAQTHVHGVGDASQPSRPMPPSSPFAFSLSQHQGQQIHISIDTCRTSPWRLPPPSHPPGHHPAPG